MEHEQRTWTQAAHNTITKSPGLLVSVADQNGTRCKQDRNGRISGDEAMSEPGKRFVRMFNMSRDGAVTMDGIEVDR